MRDVGKVALTVDAFKNGSSCPTDLPPGTWHLASDDMRFCVIGRAALDKEPMIEKRGCPQSTLEPHQDTEL